MAAGPSIDDDVARARVPVPTQKSLFTQGAAEWRAAGAARLEATTAAHGTKPPFSYHLELLPGSGRRVWPPPPRRPPSSTPLLRTQARCTRGGRRPRRVGARASPWFRAAPLPPAASALGAAPVVRRAQVAAASTFSAAPSCHSSLAHLRRAERRVIRQHRYPLLLLLSAYKSPHSHSHPHILALMQRIEAERVSAQD